MYVCILNRDGEIMLHRNMQTTPDAFLKAIAPYRTDLVVAVECMFTWYWLADLCVREDVTFVLWCVDLAGGGRPKKHPEAAHRENLPLDRRRSHQCLHNMDSTTVCVV
jgi:hypothetical protein